MDNSTDRSALSTSPEEHSAFVTTRIEGQGTQSAVGLKPYDVVSVWVKATWKRLEDIQLPFERKMELINGKNIPKIRCLASRYTKCFNTFDDSAEISNIILMFEHLKVFHSPFYEHYTKNIHKWSAAGYGKSSYDYTTDYQNNINKLVVKLVKKTITKQEWLAEVHQLSEKLFDELNQTQ